MADPLRTSSTSMRAHEEFLSLDYSRHQSGREDDHRNPRESDWSRIEGASLGRARRGWQRHGAIKTINYNMSRPRIGIS
jgi:hypothetical protein